MFLKRTASFLSKYIDPLLLISSSGLIILATISTNRSSIYSARAANFFIVACLVLIFFKIFGGSSSKTIEAKSSTPIKWRSALFIVFAILTFQHLAQKGIYGIAASFTAIMLIGVFLFYEQIEFIKTIEVKRRSLTVAGLSSAAALYLIFLPNSETWQVLNLVIGGAYYFLPVGLVIYRSIGHKKERSIVELVAISITVAIITIPVLAYFISALGLKPDRILIIALIWVITLFMEFWNGMTFGKLKIKLPQKPIGITIDHNMVALAIFLVLVSQLLVIHIKQTSYLLPSNDPWKHYFFSNFAEENQLLSDTIDVHNGTLGIEYRTIMRTNTFLFSELTQLDSYPIYRFGSILLRLIFIGVLFTTVHEFTKNNNVALLSALLAFTSWYFTWRSFNLFPENMVLIFYLASVLALERYRKEKERPSLILACILLTGSLYTHPPSIYVLGFTYFGYLVDRFISKDREAIWAILTVLAIGTLAALPIVIDVIDVVIFTFTNNVGDDAPWAARAIVQERYNPPSIADYQRFLGSLLFMLGLSGVIFLAVKDHKKQLPLIVYFGLTFTLSLGTHLNIYIPTDRMQGYLSLPILLIAGMIVGELFSRPIYKQFIQLSAIGILLAGVSMVSSTKPYISYEAASQTWSYISKLIETDQDAYFYFESKVFGATHLFNSTDKICFQPGTWMFTPTLDQELIAECDQADYRITSGDDPAPTDYLLLTSIESISLYQKSDQTNP